MHQILQKVFNYNIPFADSYLDPFLSIPIFLNCLLLERRWLLKQPDFRFSNLEIVIITIVLAVLFEEGFTFFSDKFTHDPWDYFFYLLGGIFFRFFANK